MVHKLFFSILMLLMR